MSAFLQKVCLFQIYSGLMKWDAINKSVAWRTANCSSEILSEIPLAKVYHHMSSSSDEVLGMRL